jgi:hypothetical protein
MIRMSAILAGFLVIIAVGLSTNQIAAQWGMLTPFPKNFPSLAVITPANTAHLVELARIEHPSPIYSAVWSPDGAILAVDSATGIWFYDAAAFNKPPRLFQVKGKTKAGAGIIFDAGGNELAINTDDTTTLWEMPSE